MNKEISVHFGKIDTAKNKSNNQVTTNDYFELNQKNMRSFFLQCIVWKAFLIHQCKLQIINDNQKILFKQKISTFSKE